jgi:hypothetical protein
VTVEDISIAGAVLAGSEITCDGTLGGWLLLPPPDPPPHADTKRKYIPNAVILNA